MTYKSVTENKWETFAREQGFESERDLLLSWMQQGKTYEEIAKLMGSTISCLIYRIYTKHKIKKYPIRRVCKDELCKKTFIITNPKAHLKLYCDDPECQQRQKDKLIQRNKEVKKMNNWYSVGKYKKSVPKIIRHDARYCQNCGRKLNPPNYFNCPRCRELLTDTYAEI